jgi:hypothetical protein
MDFKKEMELKEGVCVGLGSCPFFRCMPCSIAEQEMEELEKKDERRA